MLYWRIGTCLIIQSKAAKDYFDDLILNGLLLLTWQYFHVTTAWRFVCKNAGHINKISCIAEIYRCLNVVTAATYFPARYLNL